MPEVAVIASVALPVVEEVLADIRPLLVMDVGAVITFAYRLDLNDEITVQELLADSVLGRLALDVHLGLAPHGALHNVLDVYLA